MAAPGLKEQASASASAWPSQHMPTVRMSERRRKLAVDLGMSWELMAHLPTTHTPGTVTGWWWGGKALSSIMMELSIPRARLWGSRA